MSLLHTSTGTLRVLAATAVGVAGLAIQAVGSPPPGADMVGERRSYLTREPDTFVELARRFDLGFVELAVANPGVDPWVPGEGVPLELPTAHLLPDAPRDGVVINLAEQRLYFYPREGGVRTYPIGVGVAGWETPLGRTRIVGKRVDPIWYVPASIRRQHPELPVAVAPGPSNPLGRHALDLGWESYLLHGTNVPAGIGRRVSHGCIRLYPEDIEELFRQAPIGTPVTVVDQPLKVGWMSGELYVEIHPTQSQADEFEATGRFTPESVPGLLARVTAAAGPHVARVHWPTVYRAANERRGLPIRVIAP